MSKKRVDWKCFINSISMFVCSSLGEGLKHTPVLREKTWKRESEATAERGVSERTGSEEHARKCNPEHSWGDWPQSGDPPWVWPRHHPLGM